MARHAPLADVMCVSFPTARSLPSRMGKLGRAAERRFSQSHGTGDSEKFMYRPRVCDSTHCRISGSHRMFGEKKKKKRTDWHRLQREAHNPEEARE